MSTYATPFTQKKTKRTNSVTTFSPSIQLPLLGLRTCLWLLFPIFLVFEFVIGSLLLGEAADTMSCYIVGYITAACVILFVSRGIYKGTTFEITPTGVSRNLDFGIKQRKEILLRNVKEIQLKVGVLQRLFGVGTLILHTQASGVGQSKTGLSLFDLENSSEVYVLLKEKVYT